MSYNTELQANNEELQSILNTVNALPNADSGGDIDLGVTGATVGQTVRISTVDENGVPTAWESVGFPTDEHINALINTALGVIENGTY